MNHLLRLVSAGLGISLLSGCGVDLTASNLAVVWSGSTKTASVDISNVGTEDAGSFLVYFNPEEYPVSRNHRPQISENVVSLAAGQTVTLNADFTPLAHPDNDMLGRVYGIRIIVDPKNEVEESNENNNETLTPLPGSDRPDLIVTDIYQDGPFYLVVKYMNIGADGPGDFLIELSSGTESFPGNALYRFEVPPHGIEQETGGFTIGLIGLATGSAANVTAHIDWELRVDELNENNNTLTKYIEIE